jgi:hypothetical protein
MSYFITTRCLHIPADFLNQRQERTEDERDIMEEHLPIERKTI